MNDRFLRACRLEPVDATPVWFMRQAGRYLPQYRALREKYSLLELCRQPELAVAVTLQPLDVIDLDAAILFSDLLLPFAPMGLEFDFVKGEGPSIANPVRSAADVARLTTFEPEALGHVLETIRLLRRELDGRVRSSASAARRSPWPPTPSKAGRRGTISAPRRSCTSSPPAGIGSAGSSPRR